MSEFSEQDIEGKSEDACKSYSRELNTKLEELKDLED